MPLNHYTEDEPMALSSLLLVELHHSWCRQRIDLAPPDADLPVGAVLAKGDDGFYAPYLKSAETAQASAVLISPVKAGESAQSAVAIVRGVVVSAANLQFLETVTEAQKKTALEQLNALGIVPEETD